MVRIHSSKAILVLVALLLLQPQSYVGVVVADTQAPCTMQQNQGSGMPAMMSVQGEHICEEGSPCYGDCQNCAGCTHCQAGPLLSLHIPPLWFASSLYPLGSAHTYSSVTLFRDPPPPRIMNAA